MQKPTLLIANWKLNHTRASAQVFVEQLSSRLKKPQALELAIAPVAPMLEYMHRLLQPMPIALAAQNVFYAPKGAFTGEWSAHNLVDLDVTYCIVGHSERRRIFHEDDEMIAQKVDHCLQHNLVPVICVGETLAEREASQSEAVLHRQLERIESVIKKYPNHDVVIAYEPVWAIGTGVTAHREHVCFMHALIRNLLKIDSSGLARTIRILYGGSVTAENIEEIVSTAHVDGALIGGASLQAESFLSMVEALS